MLVVMENSVDTLRLWMDKMIYSTIGNKLHIVLYISIKKLDVMNLATEIVTGRKGTFRIGLVSYQGQLSKACLSPVLQMNPHHTAGWVHCELHRCTYPLIACYPPFLLDRTVETLDFVKLVFRCLYCPSLLSAHPHPHSSSYRFTTKFQNSVEDRK